MDTERHAKTTSQFREEALRTILREREAELLETKGPCSSPECRLHYAHRGPCACE